MMFDKCNSAYENSAFNLKEWEWFDKISQFRDAMQYNQCFSPSHFFKDSTFTRKYKFELISCRVSMNLWIEWEWSKNTPAWMYWMIDHIQTGL